MFVIDKISIKQSEKKQFSLDVKNVDNTIIHIPIICINGYKKGPILVLTGGQHGTEINGTEVIRKIVEQINPNELIGTIIALPILNPLAMRIRRQAYPDDIEWTTGRLYADMNRIWPGKENGSITERISYTIFEKIIKKNNVNFLIDFHAQQECYDVVSFSYSQNKKFISALGIPINHIYTDININNGWLIKCLKKINISSAIIELSPLRKIDENNVNIGIQSIKNILIFAKMTKGEIKLPSIQLMVKGELKGEIIRSNCDGILIFKEKVGKIVKKNDLIIKIYKFDDFKIQNIYSPCEGYISFIGIQPSLAHFESDVVNYGEKICEIKKEYKIIKNLK